MQLGKTNKHSSQEEFRQIYPQYIRVHS